MDYEKIQKKPSQASGGGGLSPAKLRSMLKMKKQKGEEEEEGEEDELESATFSLRSRVSEIDDSGDCCSESYKDVDVVNVVHECTTSAQGTGAGRSGLKDSRIQARARAQDGGSSDPDDGPENPAVSPSPSPFEFQKTERASHRKVQPAFSKPPPSKWDDAQKWIARTGQSSRKNSHGSRPPAAKVVAEVPGNRPAAAKVVAEVPGQQLVPYDTKRIDASHSTKGDESWEGDPYSKSVMMVEARVDDSAINLSRHDLSLSIQSATTFLPPPSTARSVSMRDMGTEMTPIASQEPSRNPTPVRATSPGPSPRSSSPTTLGRTGPGPAATTVGPRFEPDHPGLSDKELQMKTRREIQALGAQLGKPNIAAWARGVEKPAESPIETRAAAWEDAEKAKYLARFKREELKIEAWENHQKAKTEAELRKIEVEVERMRSGAHDKLMSKLAAASHRAQEKLAAVEAKRNRQAAKAAQRAARIRETGRVSSSCSSCFWCF